jgi:hypothetical protein
MRCRPILKGLRHDPTVQCFRTACSLSADETALILVRFYMSPPASPGPGDADSATYTDEHHSKDESSPTLSFRIRDYSSRTLAQALHSLVRVTRRVNWIHLYAKEPAVLKKS